MCQGLERFHSVDTGRVQPPLMTPKFVLKRADGRLRAAPSVTLLFMGLLDVGGASGNNYYLWISFMGRILID